MPAIYRTPGHDNGPGKTNYLGIRGEHGVFTPPADNQQAVESPTGISFRNITDGTSNTIAVVEAADELAVIWTKPDDLEPNEDNPINGLVGVRPGIFMAMFCDGSVRAIPALIDPEDLKALFTRDGGEIVQANF